MTRLFPCSQNIEKYPSVGFTCVNKTDPRQHIFSRNFAPFWGLPEDPVTGSYHCALAPYWSKQLEGVKSGDEIVGGQGGKRRGDVKCVWLEDEGRVLLRGTAFEGKHHFICINCQWLVDRFDTYMELLSRDRCYEDGVRKTLTYG